MAKHRHRGPSRPAPVKGRAPLNPDDLYFPYAHYIDAELRAQELARTAAMGIGLPPGYKVACRNT